MDHRDRFIFTQALAKPIVEAYMGGDMQPEELQQAIRHWCHWLYDLAGELGPQERDDDQKRMYTATFNKYKRMAMKAIKNNDSLAMVEIRDELHEKKHWLDFLRRLYTEDANEVDRLVKEADALANESDPEYLEPDKV